MNLTTEELQYLSDMVKWPNLHCSTAAIELELATEGISEDVAVSREEHRKFVNEILKKLGISEIK
jgi:hypothetical protein